LAEVLGEKRHGDPSLLGYVALYQWVIPDIKRNCGAQGQIYHEANEA
jgi:hypothetical protein